VKTGWLRRRKEKMEAAAETGDGIDWLMPPEATPSSSSSFNHDLSDARTAEDQSAKSNGVNKSAKVVLG
jgi:hypothetical protein